MKRAVTMFQWKNISFLELLRPDAVLVCLCQGTHYEWKRLVDIEELEVVGGDEHHSWRVEWKRG